MLQINNISASNFYSLGEINLPIVNGIHYVIGINGDSDSSENTSNGSGKTASFSALYQGLYNKNIKNPKSLIDSVNNAVTGKPYCIKIDFIKNNTTKYHIINNRSNNKIIIKENNKEIQLKGIANQLKQIKDILGLDFETLTSLTYISQGTLQAILDTTNKDNILYQFFNVEAIHSIESSLKEERKEQKTLRTILISRLRSAEKSLSLLTSFEKVDVAALEQNLKVLIESSLSLTKDKKHSQLSFIQKAINSFKEKLSKLKGDKSLISYKITEITQKINSFSDGLCPTCGQKSNIDLKSFKDSLKVLEREATSIEIEINKLNSLITEHIIDHKNIKNSLDTETLNLTQKINIIKSKLLVVAEQNTNYNKILIQQSELEQEIKQTYDDMSELDIHLEVVERALHLIKNGTLVNEYLNKFKKVFLNILKDLIDKTNFNIKIEVEVKNGKLDYTFLDMGIQKQYSDLSAGEKTRVSLILLISTIFTLEKVTGFSSNYLVIDEMLGVLDNDGITIVQQLLEVLRKEKAIYIITHHEEIPLEFFDSVITFEKVKGITKLVSINQIRMTK